MGIVVCSLCAIASFLCAYLLWRSFVRNGTKLLFWSSICFIGLAINNLLLVIDLHIIETFDFSGLRTVVNLAGVSSLLFGLIWDGS